MFSTPSSATIAGLQAVVAAVPLLVLGYLIADAFFGRKLDRTTCLGLTLPALMSYALVLMLVHIGTGGRVFSHPGLVRGATLLLLTALLVRRLMKSRRSPRGGAREFLVPLAAVALAFLLWGLPVFMMSPMHYGIDTRLHNGWVNQLLIGHTTPTAGITGDVPNYYPWLFHALLALVSSFTTGARVFLAQAPLQIVQVAGIVLALFALGRQLTRNIRGAWGAVLFGACTGGFGWLVARGPALANARLDYGGDLVQYRSPNVSLHNLVPVFPRDLGFALVVGVLLALALALRRSDLTMYAVAGWIVGLTGLTGGETFIFAGAVAFVALAIRDPIAWWRRALAVLVPATALALLWYAPLFLNYVKLGGFENSAFGPAEMPFWAYVVAFGVTGPLALVGSVAVARDRDVTSRLLLVAAGVVTGLIVIAGQIPRILGEGFTTLGRQHRYWPIFYLVLALFAASGFDGLLAWVERHRNKLLPVVAAAVVAVAIPSPFLGSIGATRERVPEELFSDAALGAPDGLLNAIAPEVGRACVIAVDPELSPRTFAYTGYRHVVHELVPHGDNRGRIRWTDIYETIPDEATRQRANKILISGGPGWEDAAEDFDVDIVVAPGEAASSPAFAPYPKTFASGDGRRWVIVQREPCPREP